MVLMSVMIRTGWPSSSRPSSMHSRRNGDFQFGFFVPTESRNTSEANLKLPQFTRLIYRILMLAVIFANSFSLVSPLFTMKIDLLGNIPLPWPPDEDIEALVQKSEGSFIFADTLVNFINDGHELPHRKIQKALVETSGLDTLYSQVLSKVPRGNNISRVVGTVMLLGEPLSITYLGYLLQLDAADVLQALLGLQSVLL